MKILSIDTASNICGVSILENSNLLCQLDQDTDRTHSEKLIPILEQAFNQSHLTLNDMDLLVCDKGPGSFTGIRIGIATVKAFHDSLQIPCIGVSSLEALAYSIQKEGFIISLIDCKNNNCYFALYELKNSKYTEVILPSTDSIEKALKRCLQHLSHDVFVTFVGNGSVIYKDFIRSQFHNCHFATPENNVLNSYYVGLAGLDKFLKKEETEVLPLYLKKPQAQRQLEEKFKNIQIETMKIEDLHQISNILVSHFDDFWSYDILKEELNAKNSHYLVAKFNQEIVGFAGLKVMVDEADMMNIVVHKDFRNQGIGSLLLQNLIDLSKKLHVTSISLEVMEENYSAIHLYKNFNFKAVGIRKKYYQDKNGIIMKKDI